MLSAARICLLCAACICTTAQYDVQSVRCLSQGRLLHAESLLEVVRLFCLTEHLVWEDMSISPTASMWARGFVVWCW